MKYNRTVAQPAIAWAASAQVICNLPTNPIDHLVLTMRFLNVTDEATLAEILAAIANVEVLWNGEAIVQISGADLFMLNMHLFGNTPLLSNQVATDNAARWITLIIPFARNLYYGKQGIPQTKSGQLQGRFTRSSSDAALDNQFLIIEAVELMGASPQETMKLTTTSPPAPAVGPVNIDIPRQAKLAALLIFGTTVPTSTAFTKTINSIQLLVNNRQEFVTLGNWEALRGEHQWAMGQERGAKTADGAPNDDNYLYIDLDPTNDGQFCLDTSALEQLQIQIDAGDTNPWRFVSQRYVPASLYAGNA